MSPATIRRIAIEIKQHRELLSLDAKWAEEYKLERLDLVRDTFDRISFWRAVLTDAEQRLANS